MNPHKIFDESEVDEIIRDFYDDYCTIRRMLIDEGLMTRDSNRYQVVIKDGVKTDNKINTEMDRIRMDRKIELKRQYKETKLQMGVLKIECLKNGKLFIESGQNIPGRFNRYQFELKHGVHQNAELQSDWNNFGSDAFKFELLEELKEPDENRSDIYKQLERLKEKWIEKLQPFNEKGYNR